MEMENSYMIWNVPNSISPDMYYYCELHSGMGGGLKMTGADSTVVGPQGATGAGHQGYQGNQGGVGTTGFQGNQGVAGSAGAAGSVGPQGVAGNAGSQGNQGHQGTHGSWGAIGYQGHQGNQGNLGNQGNQGHQGQSGAYAGQGHQGHQGDQGAAGATGGVGPQGVAGDSGNQGHQGHQGSSGATGGVGSQGVAGTSGNQGHQGHQGSSGSAGGVGPQGSDGAGYQGYQGSVGGIGLQGPQGSQGVQGIAGGYAGQGYQGEPGTGGGCNGCHELVWGTSASGRATCDATTCAENFASDTSFSLFENAASGATSIKIPSEERIDQILENNSCIYFSLDGSTIYRHTLTQINYQQENDSTEIKIHPALAVDLDKDLDSIFGCGSNSIGTLKKIEGDHIEIEVKVNGPIRTISLGDTIKVGNSSELKITSITPADTSLLKRIQGTDLFPTQIDSNLSEIYNLLEQQWNRCINEGTSKEDCVVQLRLQIAAFNLGGLLPVIGDIGSIISIITKNSNNNVFVGFTGEELLRVDSGRINLWQGMRIFKFCPNCTDANDQGLYNGDGTGIVNGPHYCDPNSALSVNNPQSPWKVNGFYPSQDILAVQKTFSGSCRNQVKPYLDAHDECISHIPYMHHNLIVTIPLGARRTLSPQILRDIYGGTKIIG